MQLANYAIDQTVNAFHAAFEPPPDFTLSDWADSERVLGADHPSTLTSRNNLAYAYRSAGRLEEAITEFEGLLADCERVLGLAHPITQTVRSNLTAVRRQRTDGPSDEARPWRPNA